MTTPPKKYYVRFSNIDDHDKIMAFYTRNPHDNVCGRHADLMKSLADNGSIILIEDAATGEIAGASISYPLFIEKDGIEQQKWLEIGTTRMVLNGYPGLFDIMIGMQVMRAYLVEPPDGRFVCQMESAAVQKMAHKLGFRAFVPSQELVSISDKTLEIADGKTYGFDNWYSAGPEALPVVAKRMRDVMDKPMLAHVKTGVKIELDFSLSKFFHMFEAEFRNLAGKSYGDPDQPDHTKSIAKHRQEWMRWYFK